jgi:amidase
MEQLIYASAATLARQIRAREISAQAVVEACLARIEDVNPQINAAVQVTAETARVQARAADRALQRGEDVGPLHGVPFTVKDIFDVAGVISAAGLEERRNFRPERDACVVSRLKAAGAILVGKTNCPPGGGGGESTNPVYGRTNNPYDLMRTAGSSTSGEAALIAAGGSPLGLGSDSGGSLRLPAAFCGIAALRPTVGRVPNTGVLNLPGGLRDPRSQVGPMARWVEDLALAFPLIAGMDWRDSGVIPMPLGETRAVGLKGLRLAYYTDDGIVSPTPETAAAVHAAAGALAEAGLRVEEAPLPGVETSLEISRRYWRQSELTSAESERLMIDWDEFRTCALTFMESRDVIICPAAWGPAVPHGSMRDLEYSYNLPYSLTGWPSVVVRAGTSPEKLPIGVQITARPWREDVALTVALHLERALGGWQPPPL